MRDTDILPTYEKFVNVNPVSFSKRPFRAREKHAVYLVIVTFGFVCFGTLFFLPDIRSNGADDSVFQVYNQFKRAGPEQLLVPENNGQSGNILRHERNVLVDHHKTEDIQKLKDKIEKDDSLRLLESPMVGDISDRYPLTQGGEDKNPEVQKKRNQIKLMMKHAWENYVKYAWGTNELRPISKQGHSGSVFGSMPLGATIIDSLDTLYIMGLQDEYKQAREWVVTKLNVNAVSSYVSVFEVNIRFVGGLLTCYSLTGETIYRDKAQQIADKLLPAFDTPTGIPNALVDFKTGYSHNYGWASGGSSILSEFGTLHMEFTYLSDVTGNPIYKNKVEHIRKFLQDMEKPNGLYPNYLNPVTGKWGQKHMSMGGLGDSFYEYLLKVWIQSNKKDTEGRRMFDESMKAVFSHLLQTSSNGLMYFADLKYSVLEHKMDHLACFSGGLLGLGAKTLNSDMSQRYMEVAENITNTCHESYDRSETKLGPEAFRFKDGSEARALRTSEKYYILRPEVIESYFIMYRLTKDQKYRDWGWEAAQAIEKYCRVSGGFSGVKNVYLKDPPQDDVQQSFFLAETLKYLYLLFSADDLISLDEWVFNTEAHPMPIKDVNPFYRDRSS